MLPIGKLHPLLVHFPIALVLAAAGAEIVATRTRRASWRAIAAQPSCRSGDGCRDVNRRVGAMTSADNGTEWQQERDQLCVHS